MKLRCIIFITGILLVTAISCKNQETTDIVLTKENKGIIFNSSDEQLNIAFNWAKNKALSYVGNSSDSVGPWYEASLPQREAFCMRDVSHQSIGAEILGLSKQNANMFKKFAINISESKDWCTYWEINRYNQPAPVDYRNDKEFWYNLNANFDIITAAWKLYLWTGDERYLKDESFQNFYAKSTNEYIERWQLQADKIMLRPQLMNSPTPFNSKDAFHTSRGIPSYVENFPKICVSADLLATIYMGMASYSNILNELGETAKAQSYLQKADSYKKIIEEIFWDQSSNAFYSFYTTDKKFYQGEGKALLLWFNAIDQPDRVKATINSLLQSNWNVENRSHFPVLYSRYGYYKEAYDEIISLVSPSTKRRDYPEVSYGVVEGIVSGIMGIHPSASANIIETCSHLLGKDQWAEVKNVPLIGGKVTVRHEETTYSEFTNQSDKIIKWRTMFTGNYSSILVDGKTLDAKSKSNKLGDSFSFVEVEVKPGQTISARVGL